MFGALVEDYQKLREIGINSAFELSRLDPRLAGNNFSVVLEKTIRELRGESCINLNNINEQEADISQQKFW